MNLEDTSSPNTQRSLNEKFAQSLPKSIRPEKQLEIASFSVCNFINLHKKVMLYKNIGFNTICP